MNNRSSLYNQSPLPPILAFGDYEKYAHSNETPVVDKNVVDDAKEK